MQDGTPTANEETNLQHLPGLVGRPRPPQRHHRIPHPEPGCDPADHTTRQPCGLQQAHRVGGRQLHPDAGMRASPPSTIRFGGSREKVRIRNDRIVTFDPYDDGSGIIREAQTAKPRAFRAEETKT